MKTLKKTYYVCEVCGKVSQQKERVELCQKQHLMLDDGCEVEQRYTKGGRYPLEINVTFGDGSKAVYRLTGCVDAPDNTEVGQ